MTAMLSSFRMPALVEGAPSFYPTIGSQDVDLSVIQKRLDAIRTLVSGPASNLAVVSDSNVGKGDLNDRLGLKLISLKNICASVAMYFEPAWRAQLFERLDVLLNVENWRPGDQLPSEQSFSTLLRMMIYLHPARRPTIGLSPNGFFVTGWRRGDERLIIECVGKDEVRWAINRILNGEEESAAGKTLIHRIPDVTAPYEPEVLFNNDHRIFA